LVAEHLSDGQTWPVNPLNNVDALAAGPLARSDLDKMGGAMRDFYRPATACVAMAAMFFAGCSTFESADESADPAERAAVPPANANDHDVKLLELNPADFEHPTVIDNEWWPLKPGMRWTYSGFTIEDGEEVPHSIVDTVTDLTKVINGVQTLVSLEEDYSDGNLVELEIVFHAQDKHGNVWHLGQHSEIYDEKELVGGRTWLVGHLDGAKAGIRMSAKPGLGKPAYSQGYAPPPFHWTDSARVYQMGQKTTVRAGTFDDVMVIEEWDQETPKGVFQLKYYARGVGVVRIGFRGPDPEQEEMELVRVEQLDAEELAKARAVAQKIEERAYVYGSTAPLETISAPEAR
jgi:hypothetical protein